MDKDQRIKAWQELAEFLMNENSTAFVRDVNGDLYFGHIIFVGQDAFEIYCTGPSQRAGKKYLLRWIMIDKFDEDRGKGA